MWEEERGTRGYSRSSGRTRSSGGWEGGDVIVCPVDQSDKPIENETLTNRSIGSALTPGATGARFEGVCLAFGSTSARVVLDVFKEIPPLDGGQPSSYYALGVHLQD